MVNGALIWRTPPSVLENWTDELGLTDFRQSQFESYFKTVERDIKVVEHELETEANLDSLKLSNGAQALGWRTEMARRAVERCVNINLCPVGCYGCGKQNTQRNYLLRAVDNGARILCRTRAKRIVHSNGVAHEVVAETGEGSSRRTIRIVFDHLVVSAGAIQTPHLLRKSRVSRRAGKNLQFHMNLKFIARFPDRINADHGTIFTVQLQEFIDDGLLVMASNMNPHFLSTTMAHHGNEAVDHALDNYGFCGLYVAMIRPRSQAHVLSLTGRQPLVWYRFEPEDTELIKFAFRKTAELLFAGGAVELYIPTVGSAPIYSVGELEDRIDRLSSRSVEITSVHAMASCPMGVNEDSSVTRPDGRVWGMENVIVTDASVLPTSIGESPQGTIMAIAHKITNEYLATNGA